MRIIRKTVLLFMAVLYASVMSASTVSMFQNTLGYGLESQSLNVLAKDNLGRLWIGSDVGISIISNGTVTNLRDISTPQGLIMLGNVSNILCHESGVIISSEDRIIDYRSNGSVLSVTYDNLLLQTTDFLLQGHTVLFFENGLNSLFAYDLESMQCRLITTFHGGQDYVFSRILGSQTDSTSIWLASDTLGLYHYNLNTEKLEHVNGTDLPIVAKASAIDPSNVIWLSVPGEGIKGYYINGGYEKIAEYNTGNCALPSNNIDYLTPLPDGNLLSGHGQDGICVIKRQSIRKGMVETDPDVNVRNITWMIPSADGKGLFATKNNGLIATNKNFIGHFSLYNKQADHIISYENYISAYQEPQGTIILGTVLDGICRIDPITLKRTAIQGTQDMFIVSMCRFDQNNVLMYDQHKGALLLNHKTGNVTSLRNHPIADLLSGIKSRNLKLVCSPDGNIFIFNANGQHYVWNNTEHSLGKIFLEMDNDYISEVSHACVSQYAVYATVPGKILEIDFNKYRGRVVYNNPHRESHNITSISADSRGRLFFTEPEGLHMFDPSSIYDEHLVETWGNGRFMNLAIDNRNRVWFTTTDGYLQMYNPDTRENLMYSSEDGIPHSLFTNTFSLCTTTGTILFPNASGLVTIETEGSLMQDTPPAPVSCISVRTNESTLSQPAIKQTLEHPVKLSVNTDGVVIELSANSFDPTVNHLITLEVYRNGDLVMSQHSYDKVFNLPTTEFGEYTVTARIGYRKGLSEPVTLFRYKIARPFFFTIPGILSELFLIFLIGYTIAKTSISIEKNRTEKTLAEQDIKNREDKIAFLSNIAHELRTPLSLIYNPVKDFLQEKSVDGIDYERMERIFNQVNKMTVMVNMILDSSRADVNKADIFVEEVELNQWLNFLLEDYRIDCYAKGFSLKFIMDNTIDFVQIDKRIIETGLSNMVNNAIKYSTSGTTITVSTSRNGNMIRVSVCDQGQGFSCNPEDLFKRYYRENDDSSIPGYGLGLPYARLLLSLVSGTMSASNNANGVGSTFYMEFPQAIGKNGNPLDMEIPQVTRENEDAGENTQEGMAQDFSTNDMSVMYVSNNSKETKTFSSELNGNFRIILTVSSGENAIKMMKRMSTNLVICDIDLPDMDGFELCRAIKGNLEISHIPVILLTSRTDPRNQSLGYKMGADAFLAKPYDIDQLYAIMRSLLGGRFEIKRQYNFGFFDRMSPDQTFSMTDEMFINSLNELIDQNISNPLLDDDMLHKKMSVPRSVLLKKMEGLLDTNILNYLQRIRTSMVRQKLKETGLELQVIAAETGFENVENMNAVYMKHTGKSVFAERES